MPKPKGGLGRGLGSLIPQSSEPEEVAPAPETGQSSAAQAAARPRVVQQSSTVPAFTAPGVLEVPIESISPNPRQPRQAIGHDELEDLADSIRQHGVLQPVILTYAEKGGYHLIAGERRWRASLLAGLEKIPAIIKEASSRDMLELALVENLQRADLNPLEEASAYRSLVEEFNLKQEEVAEKVGKSREAITNSLRLLRLPRPVQESLALGLITAGHARAILQVPDEEDQLRLTEVAVADGLSVRQVEALARRLAEQSEHPDQKPKPHKDNRLYDEVRALEDRFRDALGTKVQLSRSSRGGRLVIYFYSDEELGRIYGAIVGEEDS